MEKNKIYSVEEAREVLARFRAGFPNIATWVDAQQMEVRTMGFIDRRTAHDLELAAFDDLLKPAPVDLKFMERVFKEVDKITGI